MLTVDRIKELRKARRVAGRNFTESVAALKEHAEFLDGMPAQLSYGSYSYASTLPNGDVLPGKFHYTAFTRTPQDARDLAAAVRAYLRVKKSEKVLDTLDGSMSYVTQNSIVWVKVFGGEIPRNCTLIPESHSYLSYSMKCNDDDPASVV